MIIKKKIKGYFDDGESEECAKCDITCRTCNGLTNSECLECNIENFRIFDGGTCPC